MMNDQFTEEIISAAFKVHNTLGSGYLEKVYENALVIELAKRGIFTETQVPVPVFYEGEPVGDFIADIRVDGKLIIEIKAVENLIPRHEAQLVSYLNSTGIDVGLLINFGPSVTIKRKYRRYTKQ
nr:GxxExxY protein [uncultured Arsenicibacter sp.]